MARRKSLPGVRADASDQDVYEVAQALFSLVQDPVMNVFLSDNSELVDEE